MPGGLNECDGRSPRAWFEMVAPPPCLAGVVRGVWFARADAAAFPAGPIVPDGCAEFVFNLADPVVQLSGAGERRQALDLFVGQLMEPTTVRPTGRVDLVGIRLEPHATRAVLGVPGWEQRGVLAPATDVLGSRARRLWNQLGDLADVASRCEAVIGHLTAWVDWHAAGRAAPLRAVIDHMWAGAGAGRIADIALAAGASTRQLERQFAEHVGLTPKEFGRISRIHRALRLLEHDPDASGADVAASCGFADQPHLIREFRRLVGSTPARVVAVERSLGASLRGGAAARRRPSSAK